MPRGHRAFSSNLTALSARAHVCMCVCVHIECAHEGPGTRDSALTEYRTHTERASPLPLCGTLKEHNVHSPKPTMGPPQLVNIKVV